MIKSFADTITESIFLGGELSQLKGTPRYSIDADSRKSPWRITFQWENAEMKDVQLVRIEDTH